MQPTEVIDVVKASGLRGRGGAAFPTGWRLLATQEGVFVEPASATGLAALKQQIAQGHIDPTGKTAVIVLTGHGLKDPGTAIEQTAAAPAAISADTAALEAYLAM